MTMNVFDNINNIAQKTNFILGTTKLPKTVLMCQNVNIPEISVSHPTGIGGRFGVHLNVGADKSDYSDVTFQILLDEKLQTFREVLNLMQRQVHPGDGVFEDTDWEFFLLVNNNKGHPLFRIDFIHSRLVSVGEISLDSSDEGVNTMSLTVCYDYFEIDNLDVSSNEETDEILGYTQT